MRLFSAVLSTGLFFVAASHSAAFATGTGCPGISDCTPLEVVDSRFLPRTNDAAAILRDLNAKRTRLGLPLLVEDAKLDAVARAHAVDMIDARYFAHESSDGRSPFQRMDAAGIDYGYAGENIAHNTDGDSANQALWASPPHRANRLDQHFVKVGIVALATDGAGELVVEDYTD